MTTSVTITKTTYVGNFTAEGAITLTLPVIELDYEIVNKPIVINKPTTEKNKPEVAPSTKILGLKKINEQIMVNGYLKDDIESTTTTLNEGGTLAADDMTITLTSATNFRSYGAILIDNELIFHTGKSSNNLTGCLRGRAGTIATTHTDGSTVYSVRAAQHQMEILIDFINTGGELTSFVWKDKTFNNASGGIRLIKTLFKDVDVDPVNAVREDEVKYRYTLTLINGIDR